MISADNVNDSIRKLQLKASTDLDKRVHDDISIALARSQGIEPPVTGPTISRFITKGRVTKFAVAAAILIAFGIGFSTGRRSRPAQPTPDSLDVIAYTSIALSYPTAPKTEDSFWRQKALAAIQPRPHVDAQFTKTKLPGTYKQYLKEKKL
ncbi:MAG: hypothetical protein AMJ65_16870 [Phycisphaerae bacterium SG8_4]|nr:MAG: hypothetical protein AMJ65_16870 [Phycisphaerae bacterium SG8_4]